VDTPELADSFACASLFSEQLEELGSRRGEGSTRILNGCYDHEKASPAASGGGDGRMPTQYYGTLFAMGSVSISGFIVYVHQMLTEGLDFRAKLIGSPEARAQAHDQAEHEMRLQGGQKEHSIIRTVKANLVGRCDVQS
jgi:hypothetical protein